MLSQGEAFDVLEHAKLGLQFADQPNIMENQLIALVIHGTLAHEGKPLAGRASKDDIDICFTKIRKTTDFVTGQIHY